MARDLSISAWSLGEWVKQARAGQALKQSKTLEAESPEPFRQAQGPEPAEGQRELRRLRAEVDYLRQQRDILKKALGILSAEMPASVSR